MAGVALSGSKQSRAKVQATTLTVRFPELDKRAPLIVPHGAPFSPWGDYSRAKGAYIVADLEEAERWLQELDSTSQAEAEQRLRKRIKRAEKATASAKLVRRGHIEPR